MPVPTPSTKPGCSLLVELVTTPSNRSVSDLCCMLMNCARAYYSDACTYSVGQAWMLSADGAGDYSIKPIRLRPVLYADELRLGLLL